MRILKIKPLDYNENTGEEKEIEKEEVEEKREESKRKNSLLIWYFVITYAHGIHQSLTKNKLGYA